MTKNENKFIAKVVQRKAICNGIHDIITKLGELEQGESVEMAQVVGILLHGRQDPFILLSW